MDHWSATNSLHASLSSARDLRVTRSRSDVSCPGIDVDSWFLDKSSPCVVFRKVVYLFRSWLSIVGSDVGVRP